MTERSKELKCIFCAKNSLDGPQHKLTNEHIIPECLGGWITIPFLCGQCNNKLLGSQVEGRLKQNAYIVAAIDKTEIGTAYKTYNRADITVEFEDGKTVRGKYDRKHQIKLVPTPQSDGSLIASEEESKAILFKQIKRFERDNNISVSFDEKDYESSPYDVLIKIPNTDKSFIKSRDAKGITLISNLVEPIPFLVPMSIAFENIAGFSYQFAIQPAFDPLRDWINNDQLQNKVMLLNPIDSSIAPNEYNYEPYHHLRYSMVNDGLVALVVLFNQITFSVFMGFNPNLNLLQDTQLLDKYMVYDLKNQHFSIGVPSKDVFDEDSLSLETVYNLAHCELRMNQ